MAKEQKMTNTNSESGGVVLKKCCYSECRAKEVRAGFCDEHYSWFKAGVLTKDGLKPRDFDKKYLSMKRRKAA